MSDLDDTQRLAHGLLKKQTQGKKPNSNPATSAGRVIFLSLVLALLPLAIVVRAAYIQLVRPDFLVHEGDARIQRLRTIEASRGMITDRNGEELAISIPTRSVWIDPRKVIETAQRYPKFYRSAGWRQLAKLLGRSSVELAAWTNKRKGRRFDFLRRHLDGQTADVIHKLKLPGVHLLREPRRFYPAAEVAAQVVGFTNVDGQGIEGLERAYDTWLSGNAGEVLLKRDLLGNVIERGEILKAPRNGNNLALSLDNRIQTIAYVELKLAVQRVHARAGTAVVLDVNSGEVLAMVNQPSYNPNNRRGLQLSALRNRTVTDVFEPGSTLKPFTALAAIESGKFRPDTIIDTQPMKVNGYWVGKGHHYGPLTVTDVIKKSSNVGVTKMALALPTDTYINMFSQLGFGSDTGSGFPGERSGVFRLRGRWSDIDKATLSYGYGISVTALQLARAYSVLGSGGILRPISLIRQEHGVSGQRLFPEYYTHQVLQMMEHVVERGGTGIRARVGGYRVAGKTGTARVAVKGGYGDDYQAVFAGIAPLTKPRLVVVVMIDSPKGDEYYGGQLAAPVFAAIMERSLRWLDVPPDGSEKVQFTANSTAMAGSGQRQTPPHAARRR